MANGKKIKKGVQIGPDVKKIIDTTAEVLVGPANQIAKSIGYKKVAKTVAETIAGPAYQGAKALYNYINPSTAKEISAKKLSSPKLEKINDLGVLKEHEVVTNKSENKNTPNSGWNEEYKSLNKSLGSQGAENMKKAPIIPVKNPLENRSDLKRNSVAMMKVKNPQKKY